jgi:membrane protease YdiL (CAAX protease family)
LICLVLHASLEKDARFQKFYLALALAPLVRILSLAMPLANFPQIYWYVIVAVPLLLAAITVMVRLRLRPKDVGLTLNCLPLQLMVGMTGVIFGLAEFYILRPEPLAGAFAWDDVILPAVILFIGTGFAEEFIFRGVMQRAAGEALGGWGWVFIALVFAALHIGYLSIADLGLVFAVGLFFGLVAQKTGSILGTTISHGITNIVLYLAAPFFL